MITVVTLCCLACSIFMGCAERKHWPSVALAITAATLALLAYVVAP